MKNIPKKDWWFCNLCDKTIKDKYPLKVHNTKVCAIYNPVFHVRVI